MPAPRDTPTTVLLRADATAAVGVGHTMRLLALSQELISRGERVRLAGDIEVEWVAKAYAEAGTELLPRPATPAEFVSAAHELCASTVILDRYDLGPAWGQACRAAGLRTMALVDGPFGGEQDADVYLDQNPGSPARAVESGQVALAGADYTLFRDDVLRARDERASGGREASAAVSVLAVFGGTDPFGAADVVAPLILQAARQAQADLSDIALDLTVVSRNLELAATLRALAPEANITVIDSLSDLAARAGASDLVVTASGSTVWELLCIGVPTAVVCVVDNQTPGYDYATNGGYVTPVGRLEPLRQDEAARVAAIENLRDVIANPQLRRERAERGQALIDGRGRERVADVLLGTRR